MILAKTISQIWRPLVSVTAALALAGCFTSATPVITPQNADYPFKSITFFASDDDDKEHYTIARRGDVYVEPSNADDDEQYLVVTVAEGLYAGQFMERDDEGELETLYGIVQMTDKDTMTIFSTICDHLPADILTAAKVEKVDGEYGDTCRITSLDQLKTLARLLIDSDVRRQTYRIVELIQ